MQLMVKNAILFIYFWKASRNPLLCLATPQGFLTPTLGTTALNHFLTRILVNLWVVVPSFFLHELSFMLKMLFRSPPNITIPVGGHIKYFLDFIWKQPVR